MTQFNKLKLWTFFLITPFCFASCASWYQTKLDLRNQGASCTDKQQYSYTESELPKSIENVSIDSLVKAKLSARALNMANAIGVLEVLKTYAHLKREKHSTTLSLEDRMSLLELEQELSTQINEASLAISSVSSVLDCEEERTMQVVNYLKGKEGDLESNLTMAAIGVGAGGAIASASIKNDDLNNTVGIVAGMVEATLGVIMLFNNRKIDFYHERNVLKDIWDGPKVSEFFPAFVWYYLNTPLQANAETQSIRDQIILQWENYGQISKSDDTKLLNLYFGKGGRYNTSQLENRADMYDQLESQIKSIKQDLTALSDEINKL